MGDFCCDTRQQMIKGATVEPALRPKFVLWFFFMFRDFICYNFICPMFFPSTFILWFYQCLWAQFSWIRTVSRILVRIFVDNTSSANQRCCPVSYFDEHLILWVRSINNEIYPNFVTVNDDKAIDAGVECKEEKQSVVWRTYKRRKVSIVSRHILFEFAFRVIFFWKSMF